MINLSTATPLQVKVEVDRIANSLPAARRQIADGIARKFASTGTPFSLSAVRNQVATVPNLPPAESLLVVIAIIAILIGLLLPAVQKVRLASSDPTQAKYDLAIAALTDLVK